MREPINQEVSGESRCQTGPVLELHFSGNGVYQAITGDNALLSTFIWI